MKSFDYRVLCSLVEALYETSLPENVKAMLAVDDWLADIADDLLDYEDDVVANAFNIYRGFIHIHGSVEGPQRLVQHINALEVQQQALMQQIPDESRRNFVTRLQQITAREGSARWQLPSPIPDEVAFRKKLTTQTSA